MTQIALMNILNVMLETQSDMENKDTKEFIKGFEQGYWLKRGNRPELPNIMELAQENPTYAYGLKSGAREAEREKIRKQLTDKSGQSKDTERGVEFD